MSPLVPILVLGQGWTLHQGVMQPGPGFQRIYWLSIPAKEEQQWLSSRWGEVGPSFLRKEPWGYRD